MKPKMNHSLKVLVKKLDKEAKVPSKELRDIPDAGWDIFTSEGRRIPGGGKYVIKTGIAMAIPEGWHGHIRPRSSVAASTPLMIDAGVIDPGYRGEIKIVLVNTSEFPFDVSKGMKIAQIVFEPIPSVEFEEVADLPPSDRGKGGFGSTDK
jgi:deoxyuridine 5'-triphosphate nucleotidohydrolase